MKKILYNIMLIILLTPSLQFNAYNVSESINIIEAIKNSDINLLEKTLDNIELKEDDKIALLTMANSISQELQIKMAIDFIKENNKPLPSKPYDLISTGIILATPLALIYTATKTFVSKNNLDKYLNIILSAGIITGTVLSLKKLKSISKEKNEEILKEYNTVQQKFIDSLKIISILNAK
ncbi:hypothetical protein [Candidatus Babela massiliensis]|uniref:Uncharacterized protein n=1 Tax=Candidatus Babela massiliensis TaxID=673862 RepID=V6DGW0_9BACT|nr:hypothetical protein [Candidatus Babela massiliensis]CDK30800.1 hypothetical protein BABL1_gene_215 [Candidatus Babela massiliensis]